MFTFGLPDLRGVLSVGNGSGSGIPFATIGDRHFNFGLVLSASNLPAGSGGSAVAVSDLQSTQVTTYYIRTGGTPLAAGTDTTPDLPFTGAIINFTADFAPGPGYAECNGQLLTIAGNADLYSVLGTRYGGDGVTTFALPDLRGRALVGASADHPLGQAFGSSSLQITQANMPINMGGLGVPLDNHQPSLAVTYVIALTGVFPPENGYVPDSEAFVGEVVAFAGNYAPAGYHLCDGALLNIGDYPALFALIGTTYGGDGRTTFALPDLTGRSVIGMGQALGGPNYGLGQLAGSADILLTSADMPSLIIDETSDSNALFGGDAADVLNGLAGDDRLVGNGGFDQLNGGDGIDNADYRYATSRVSVSLAIIGSQDTLGAGIDILSGIENLTGSAFKDQLSGDSLGNALNGLGGKDRLKGAAGDDSLDGGDGADQLVGGLGGDLLTGGKDGDVFIYTGLAESRIGSVDLITDLNKADRIDLTAIDADRTQTGDQAFHLITGAFTHQAGELRLTYDAATRQTTLEADNNGDGVADLTILISGDRHDFSNFLL
jgi:microcystin-dependent protein